MSFYQKYTSVLHTIIAKAHSADIPGLVNLLSTTPCPSRTVRLNEVEDILKELQFIDLFLKDENIDDPELKKACKTLGFELSAELTMAHQGKLALVSELTLEKWLKANLKTGQLIICNMGRISWVEKELLTNPTRYADTSQTLESIPGISSMVLNRRRANRYNSD